MSTSETEHVPVSPRAHGSMDTPAHPPSRARFLSEAQCRDIGQRLARIAVGGGATGVAIWSNWTGYVRWARNQITTSGDVSTNYIKVQRDVRGAKNGLVFLNQATDEALLAAARRAERLSEDEDQVQEWDLPVKRYVPEETPRPTPDLFSEPTYALDAEARTAAAIALMKASAARGMLSAGYIEVSAHCVAIVDSLGHLRYVPYTRASYSVSVRDPEGSGSGWAGMDWSDWGKIDASKLTGIALDKCLASRNPVRVEPGRYVAILEPQAVHDFVGAFIHSAALNKDCSEWMCFDSVRFPFTGIKGDLTKGVIGQSLLGEPIIDKRISVWSDPVDPELVFPPFQADVWASSIWQTPQVFHRVSWITNGILTSLAYNRDYAIQKLASNTGLPNEGGYHMSGGNTSLDEMIATTTRGVLVTRFSDVINLDFKSQLYRGYTRDGLWLIENGKISKPIKNFAFTESVLFALNKVLQLGVPQRVWSSAPLGVDLPQPAVVPPLKIDDFSFTALTSAV